jgi:hypothetical protein
VGIQIRKCAGAPLRPDGNVEFCADPGADRPRTETLQLGVGTLHVMDAARHCKITCTQGAVWVTGTNRLGDHVLKAGESLLLQGRNKVLVSGGGDACMVWICRE